MPNQNVCSHEKNKRKEKEKRVIWTHGERNRNRAHRIGSYRCVPHNTATDWPIFFGVQIVPSCVSVCCAVLCCAMKLMPLPQSFTCMAIRKRARTNRQYTFQCYDYRHNMCCFYIHSTSILLWNILVFVYVVAWTREEERNKTYARYALRFMCACSPLFYSDYLNLRQQIDKIFFLWPINCFAEMIQWILT